METGRQAEGGGRRAGWRILPLPPRGSLLSGHALVAIALSLAVFVLGVRVGSRTAGGSDSYGYISQADLWLRGTLHVDQPWVARFAWPNVDAAFTPLGYRPATRPHAIVPIYPPGLPLLMAVFAAVGGRMALYLVVPLMGALGVWLTWRLGRQALGDTGGVLAAVLLASSPAFVFHLLQPMSDVPAMTAWLAAFLLVIGPPPRPLLAGLAASAAILIRPSLAPLAAVLVVPLLGFPFSVRRLRPVAALTLGVVPGVVVYAAFNAALYGGPLRNGYGNFSELFTVDAAGGTLFHYLGQLIDTQTIFVALAPLGCLAMARKRPPAAREPRVLALTLAAIVLVVFGVYAFYVRFEEWTYLRYLLPAYPALLVLSIAGLQWLTGRVVAQGSALAAVAICLFVASVTWRHAMQLQVFEAARFEARYEKVAEAVGRLTPSNAAILSMQHSGTVRYYASRVTVRYDIIEPGSLDEAVRDLKHAGYRPYILLEEFELEPFRHRFAPLNKTGELDWWPVARLSQRPAVFLYEARDTGPAPQPSVSR